MDWWIATYTKDAIWMTNYIGLTEWKAYGIFWYNDYVAGVSCLDSQHWPGHLHWYFATTYTRDTMRLWSENMDLQEYLAYGYYSNHIAYGGISYVDDFKISYAYPVNATRLW